MHTIYIYPFPFQVVKRVTPPSGRSADSGYMGLGDDVSWLWYGWYGTTVAYAGGGNQGNPPSESLRFFTFRQAYQKMGSKSVNF